MRKSGVAKTGIAAAGAAAAVLLTGAAPARADDAFRVGFEHEAGRLVAREMLRIGHVVAFHALHPRPVVVRERVVVHRPHRRHVTQHVHGPRCEHGAFVQYGYAHRHGRHAHAKAHRRAHRAEHARGHRHGHRGERRHHRGHR